MLIRRLYWCCRNILRSERIAEDLDQELRSYLEFVAEEKQLSGITPEEAMRQARREIGTVEQIKECVRDVKGGASMDRFFQDLRSGLGQLRRSPGFTLVAVLALAIGIGANTAVFSVINKVLLQPLPYQDPERIVQLGRKFPAQVGYLASIPNYMIWRRNEVFSSMALYDYEGPGFNVTTSDHREQIKGAHVSVDYFTVFGVSPAIGRIFSQAEDLPNGPKAALISARLWRSHFGSDAQILTRTIDLNSSRYPIVGVIPPRFSAVPEADVWIPLQADPNSTNHAHFLLVTARLKPGVSVAQAQAGMRVAGESFRRLYPKQMDKTESVAVVPMLESIVGNIRISLYVLFAAVAVVLLIACANVASLLLARSAGRRREFAIRAALGASRWRIVRQLFTENMLLSTLGGFLGLLLGVLGFRALVLLAPSDIPRLEDPAQLNNLLALVDWRILIFTAGVSLFTSVLFGLIPVLQISKPNVAPTLGEGGTRLSTSRHQKFTSNTLVAVETALAVMLLASAALLIRSFANLSSVESGIDSHQVLTMLTSLAGDRYQTTEAMTQLTRQALQNIESIAGVESASTSLVIPATNSGGQLAFDIPGKAVPSGQEHNGREQWRSVSPHFFKVFRVPLLRGRVFAEHDDMAGAPVAIVSAAFARKFFANEHPIGKTLAIGKGIGPIYADYAPRVIVGVVGDICETGLAGGKVPIMYVPQAQQQQGITKTVNGSVPLAWEVRSSLDQKSLTAAVAKTIHTVDGRLPIGQVRPMDRILADSISRQSFNMLLLTIFASSALLLAAIGIYGVVSFSVQQRTKEIGVRVALGAGKNTILAMIMREGLAPALIGIIAGFGGSLSLTRLLKSLLFGVTPTDPVSFFAVAALLFAVALIAILIPAQRAISSNPVSALRTE